MLSKVGAFGRVGIISSLDIGGLGLLESLLLGNNISGNSSVSLVGNVGFVILSLNKGWVIDPWESLVENITGGLKVSGSSNVGIVGRGSGSIGGESRLNTSSVSGLGGLLFGNDSSGGFLGWNEGTIGLAKWVLRVKLNSGFPSDSSGPFFSSWVKISLSIITLGLSISSKSNVGLQSISGSSVSIVS